jgi:hypothetical protein
MLRINGTEIEADEFAWDGCHKLYVVTDQHSRDELESYGYDFYPVAELPRAWELSCWLRFIQNADLTHQYVGQGDDEDHDIEIEVT